MPRNMSFALTTGQMKEGSKTVTRRLGWWFLDPGEIVNAVEKAMGLRKGETIKKIGQIRIIQCRPEPLINITQQECVLEGFPNMAPEQFIEMFCQTHKGCSPRTAVNRIEFEHL
ncbi:MAG: hypothetical protein KJP07_08915 [Desulfatitalea sp.]|nr:hypothetical protein [Desulfatitalea sp.]